MQRKRRAPLKGQIGNRITRVSRIHLHARLIVIRHLHYIDRDLVVRRAAVVHADVEHGGVDVVHAGFVGRLGRAAGVRRDPETHDASRARIGPVPDAERGVGGVEGGADVVDDGDAVVPRDVEASAVVEEKGAVDGGGGDLVDGAVAGVFGYAGALLNDGSTWVTTVCIWESRGEEKESEELERGGDPHAAVFGYICSLDMFDTSGVDCQGLIYGAVDVVKSGDIFVGDCAK